MAGELFNREFDLREKPYGGPSFLDTKGPPVNAGGTRSGGASPQSSGLSTSDESTIHRFAPQRRLGGRTHRYAGNWRLLEQLPSVILKRCSFVDGRTTLM